MKLSQSMISLPLQIVLTTNLEQPLMRESDSDNREDGEDSSTFIWFDVVQLLTSIQTTVAAILSGTIVEKQPHPAKKHQPHPLVVTGVSTSSPVLHIIGKNLITTMSVQMQPHLVKKCQPRPSVVTAVRTSSPILLIVGKNPITSISACQPGC